MKDLTLLVCNHNHGRFLKRMLRDVFNQTLDPSRWQLLIVHDECSDGSEETFREAWEELCQASGRPVDWLDYASVSKDKKNGLANCKNFGLRRCDTEYVAYLDADDGMFPQRLEMQLAMLTSPAGRYTDVCVCQAWDLDKNKLLVNCFDVGQYRTHVQIEQRLRQENVICHGSVMFRKQAVMDVDGYRETSDVLGREDWDLWLRMIAAGKKFYTVPERLYIWSMGTSTER